MFSSKLNRIFSVILTAVIIMIFTIGCGAKGAASSDDVAKSFTFTVTDAEGNAEAFEITTNKTTVGDALLDEGLIEGDEGQYGLYVTKVNGIEAIYENDGTYWSFYINGEYAMTGVDSTEVEDGAAYEFKVEGD